MAVKVNRALLGALAISLAAHLLLLGTAGNFGFTPEVTLEFPIEASLVAAEPAQVATPTSRRAPSPPALPAAVPEPVPPAVIEPAVATASPAEPVPERPSEPVPVPPAVPAPVPEPEPSPVQAPPLRSAVRSLADNLVIHYRVQTGEDGAGFVAGRATYIWHNQDGRYSLVSTLEATGLAALFISGRIVQVSEGTVDGTGLHPAQYHLQRNQRKQDVARFGWSQNRLTMEGRPGVALTPQAQDLLSFPFHLAMTVREGEGDFTLGVTNGRKFNEFAFRVVGREVVDVAGRQLNTLHLHGEKTAEGTLDVWLDMDRSGLPVKVRTYDRKGKVAMMQLEGVETPGRDSGE